MSDDVAKPDSADRRSSSASAGAQDDLHRKFREALDRKKKTKHPSAALGEEGEGKGHFAARGAMTRKREFRRKSG